MAGLAAATTTGVAAAPGLPAAAGQLPRPVVKLEAAQHDITVQAAGGGAFVDMDPAIWVASLGVALQFDVRRASYTKPVTITQVIHLPGGPTMTRALPGSLLDGWNGLKDFVKMTVRNSKGKVVASPELTFCPNSFDAQQATPGSPATSRYPQECGFDPFPLSMVMGVERGWAVDLAADYPLSPLGPGPFMQLKPGKYKVTDTIGPAYVKLLHVSAADATAAVTVTVVKAGGGSGGPARTRATRNRAGAALPELPRVPTLSNPPKSTLPDLIPLPSWGISASRDRSGQDLLSFGATVWSGGNGPLDVVGFRHNASLIMKAYQYFWRDGKVVGRVRAGTMGFDSKKGHNHWHFEQFARYTLLDSAKKLAVPSRKVGFCIGPSDPVDLLAPHAVWQPALVGQLGRILLQCGVPSSLSVQEALPVGWGDTYFQSVAGQSFDITHLPNGTYYIEITANPERVLHETDTGNDVSLRKVILGGKAGHRTVKVPAWHGIDPEP
jgi:hypothetical protein